MTSLRNPNSFSYPLQHAEFSFLSGELRKLPVNSSQLKDLIEPYLTEERKSKIQELLRERTYNVTVGLEGIYDEGNINAVTRTAESMGLQSMHIMETGYKSKPANRVASGADKWMDVLKYKTTRDCIINLKERGYKVCVTNLESSVPITEIDFTQPTALIFGNERLGVSQEMSELADVNFMIPMRGFTQSLNISVAAGMSLFYMLQDRLNRQGYHGDLTEQDKETLKALFYYRTIPNAQELLKAVLKREFKK